MVVREGGPDDVDALVNVHGRAWRLGYEDVLPHDVVDAWERDEVRARLAALLAGEEGQSVLVAATADGVPRGFVAFGPARDDERREEGELVALFVEPAGQLAGLGSRLHDTALEALRARGFADAVAWVFTADAQGRGFAERRGWVADGQERTDEAWDVPAVRLRRSLAP